MNPDDEKLERALRGDRGALEALLEAILQDGDFARLIQARIGEPFARFFTVDDVQQITCLEVFLNLAKFDNRGPGAFRAWVTEIALHSLLDGIRYFQRDKRRPGEGSVGDAERTITISTPSRALSREESDKLLRQALNELPAAYREVVELYDLEQLPIAIVAEKLGCSPGAVHMRRGRARDRLRELLPPESQIEFPP